MRARLRRLPRALWVCAALATLNACLWAVVTPTWQVPDEPVHFAYTQYLAETGKVPRPIDTLPGHFNLSEEAYTALSGVPFTYQGTPNWERSASDALQAQLRKPLNRVREAGAGAAANYPPLYYAYEAIPYKIASGSTLLTRLLWMRVFSALLLGLTTAFTFMFLRELLPGSPRAWTVGALAVAFQPLAAFVSGGVNADAGLWASSAAVIWLIARGFRCGLTRRLGAGLGVALACALLTKGSAFALVPPVGVALLVFLWRARGRPEWRAVLTGVAGAAALPALGFALWLLISSQTYHRSGGATTAGLGNGGPAAPQTSIREQLSYLWQTFLPRLPFMNVQFNGQHPVWTEYFQGFVGRFGYNQYQFPLWVSKLGLAISAVVGGLCVAALGRARVALRGRVLEFGTYLALLASMVTLVGVAGYHFRKEVGLPFEQARYLFPLLPLYGAVIALAVRGAGRRFGSLAAGALIAVFVVHNFFAILLTLGRYYS